MMKKKKTIKAKTTTPLKKSVSVDPECRSIKVYEDDKLTINIVAPNNKVYDMAVNALKLSEKINSAQKKKVIK